ncbi:MAG: proton-conducting transporter membrane subunit [Elusimicrobiales bacterium]|nr:proton-conducting transporter membrane subunit [Elusimicrobiales bacterium]
MVTSLPYFAFIAVPALAALACPFAARIKPRYADILANTALAVGLLTALSFIPEIAKPLTLQAWNMGTGLSVFNNDVFSLLMLITVYMVALCTAFYSIFHEMPDGRRGVWNALILVCAAAMCGVAAARDFFTLYVFVEVTAVASYALIAFEDRRESTEGALKYFFLTAPASTFIVLGVALLMLYTGGTSFGHLAQAMSSSGAGDSAVAIILGVMACGFMVKAGLVPFHGWTPDAYQSAPAPVSALLSGVVTKAAGVYALIRIALALRVIYPAHAANAVGQALMFFGALSIVIGALGAVYQRDFKRMLAFSSISQVGYIVLAAGAGTPLALAGALFHLFNHATFKTALFLNSAAVEKQTGTTDMRKLGGLEARMPWTALTSNIAILSTAGIPPLSGFWSKLIIIVALWKAGLQSYAAIAIFASVLTLAYFILMQSRVFFGKTPEHLAKVSEARAGMLLPPILLAAVMIAIGFYFPLLFSNLVEPAAKAFL